MTKIQPITSEEVLTRQVKESSLTALQPSDSSLVQQSSANPPTKQAPKETGFKYRLPLGAYLLAFLYAQICLFAVLSVGLTIALYTSTGQTQIWGLVSQKTWITIVVSASLSIFILSGRNTLRWFAIAGASILTALLGYQAFNAIVLMESDRSAISYIGSSFSSAIGSGLLVLAAGMILNVVTIVYLLRKKVTVAYE